MIKLHQTKFGEGKGNCFSTCVACLFDIEDINSVPNFCVDYDDWFGEFCNFLDKFGYTAIMLMPNSELWERCKDTFLIAGGPGPRGCEHAVITKGDQLYWDPHPSGNGLLEIKYVTIIFPKEIKIWNSNQ